MEAGATAEHARLTVWEFLHTWLLSPRAFAEYERRCADAKTAGAIAQAAWLLAPSDSPARDEVAEALVRRLGHQLDATGLGSLFLGLADRAEAHRAWHLLALACDGIWPVALGDARRSLLRGDAWLPTSADPTWIKVEPAPGEATHPAFPDLPPTLPSAEELLDAVTPAQRRLLQAYLTVGGNLSELARQWRKSPEATWQQFERLRRRLRRLFGIDQLDT